MMVDEQIAKAWGKLNDCRVIEWRGRGPAGGWYEYTDAVATHLGNRVPDPAKQPWEWVKAFITHADDIPMSMGIETVKPRTYSITIHRAYRGDDVMGEGDTPEAALEAAIRAWGVTA